MKEALTDLNYLLLKGYRKNLPPLAILNLMPKSASGPPGLCDAVRMMPPSVLYFLMTQDRAGVDMIPSCPTITLDTLEGAKLCGTIKFHFVDRIRYYEHLIT